MLFWLCIIVGIISIILFIIYESVSFKYDIIESLVSILGAILGVMSAAAIIFSLAAFCINYTGINGDIAEYKEHYNTLVFEVENNLYKDDVTTVSRHELVKEIQKWNCDLAKRKENQRDFWIGIYIPDIYDDFEFIPLDGLLKEGESI